jgi:hypothetical protein
LAERETIRNLNDSQDGESEDVLELRRSEILDVEAITYDTILESQAAQLSGSSSRISMSQPYDLATPMVLLSPLRFFSSTRIGIVDHRGPWRGKELLGVFGE